MIFLNIKNVYTVYKKIEWIIEYDDMTCLKNLETYPVIGIESRGEKWEMKLEISRFRWSEWKETATQFGFDAILRPQIPV